MSIPAQDNSVHTQEQKPNDKEYNFRQLEAKYQRELAQERAKREEAERMTHEIRSQRVQLQEEESDDNDPYVDHKKFERKMTAFEKRMEEKIDKKAEEKARSLIDNQKKDMWMRNNPDFFDVLQYAERFAQSNPGLAETILEMPEGFERQKLVYSNIKALGLDKPEQKQPSVQDKIDANRKSPYYQPSGIGAAPYNAGSGDFSPSGQKNAYAKMQELKAKMRV